MIIAIDETGDFAPYSKRYNFFVAALLDQTNDMLVQKEEQFNNWKNTVPKEKRTKGNEVKGTELSDEELHSFTMNVLLSEPLIRNVQVRIIPAENSQAVAVFKEVEAELIEKSISYLKVTRQEKKQTLYERLYKWNNRRNFQHFIKLGLLQSCISKSLNLAVGTSLVSWIAGSDDNLMNIAIKIDADFIRKDSERMFFKELLKQSIRNKTEQEPIPMLKELVDSHHPFSKYIFENNMINLSDVLGKRCNFYNSHEHFELQIADILGTIIHRYNNYKRCTISIDEMNHILGANGQVKVHLIMNKNPSKATKLVIE
jgi:hypothetical protein